MKKPFKILSSSAMAAALATTALVPAASAAESVPTPATQLAEVIFESKGQLVSLDVANYVQALAADAVVSVPSHISAKDGSVYKAADYVQALAAGETPEKALAALYNAEKAIKATVVPGKIVNKVVVAEKEVEVIKDGKLNIQTVEQITADGVTTEVVKFQILDKEGKVDKTANDVVLEIGSTYGFLSQQRLTIQNGEGEVILRSEFLKKETEAKITAQVIEAKDSHKHLIGKLAGETTLKFMPAGTGGAGEEVTVKQVLAANSNQADRVTLFFDEEVTPADFYTVEDDNRDAVRHLDNVKIGNKKDLSDAKAIAGFLFHEDNPKAVTVVLQKDAYLTDNTDVYVSYDHLYDGSPVKNSTANFKLADARVANVTSVEPKDNRTLIVSFSEAIDRASFTIDGRHFGVELGAPEEELSKADFTYEVGDIEFVNGRYVDNRDEVEISLTNYQEPEVDKDGKYIYPQGYFKPGFHALETANIYDFAANTDSENIGKTQVLEFEIKEDGQVAEVTQEVHSPEQFKVEFNKPIEFRDASGNKSKFEDEVFFQAWDEEAINPETGKKGAWVNVEDYFADVEGGLTNEQLLDLLEITQVNKADVYKVELKHDWTHVYNTKVTKDNYYNDQFRLAFNKNSILTVGNGNLNKEVVSLPLTYINGKATALATPDTESPVIRDIKKAENFNAKTNPRFVVKMSEPVKLFPDGDTAGSTLSQAQVEEGQLPETQVEFLGKDKNGKTRTFIGKVVDFGDAWDTNLIVEWENAEETPQTLVDAGGNTNWTIVVKSISDDVGNTAATVTRDFTLTKTPEVVEEGEFRVVPTGGTAVGEDGSKATYQVKGEKGEDADTIEITFTEAVAVTGLGSATNVKNYSLNGKDLPTGASIALGTIDGKVVDPKKVVITMKHEGKNVLKDTNVITLAKQIKSASGKDLKYDVTFTFETSSEATPELKEALKDAIAKAEKADTEGKTEESVKAYEEALKAAKDVAEKEDATQEEVDAAEKALKDAIEGLEKDDTPVENQVKVKFNTLEDPRVQINPLGHKVVGFQVDTLETKGESYQIIVKDVTYDFKPTNKDPKYYMVVIKDPEVTKDIVLESDFVINNPEK